MTTIIKKISANKSNTPLSEQQTVQKNISLDLVDLSPDNYRIYFCPVALNELATDMTLHGMISPVTVRPMPTGRYELVVGERRIRAARIATLEIIPAVIKELTDEQAEEMRLSENLQRENPHPMDEANRIGKMQREGKTIAQIAERLSKSKTFIYARLKLSALILPLQELFFAEKLSLSEAMEIAALAPSSQEEIFERHCIDWQEENFTTHSFKYIIGRYKYDLSDAPFDVQDSQLIPQAGACSTCPFNSATLISLFPEMAEDAICTNKACYHSKCLTATKNEVLQVVENFAPLAIIYSGSLSEENQIIVDSLDQTAGLPQYSTCEVMVLPPPTMPDQQDYTDEDDGESFDQIGYDLAMQEYNEDLSAFNERTASGEFSKGLYFHSFGAIAVLFTERHSNTKQAPQKATAKQVQEAIKQGTQTTELLQGEVSRLHARESRAKQIDREKVQLNLHQHFCDATSTVEISNPANSADLAAARLLVYQSLKYEAKSRIDKSLLVDENLTRITDPEKVYQKLASLTESEYALMIRLAVCGQGESKIPTNISGIALYQLAVESSLDVQQIENKQAKIAKQRLKKLKPRLKDLETRIKRMDAQNKHKEAA